MHAGATWRWARFARAFARAAARRVALAASWVRALPARRPWHVAMAAFAAGLALAPADGRMAVVGAAGLAALLALARADALGAVAALLLIAGGMAGQARLHAIDAPAHRVH